MGVSDSHIRLVQELRSFVEAKYGGKGKLIVFTDNPDSAFKDHVPKIGEAFPDLYARCYCPDIIILGEAKTVNDVESRHSILQYKYFIQFCAQNTNSCLIFAVPWTVIASLKNTIRNVKRQLHVDNVEPVYLEPLSE